MNDSSAEVKASSPIRTSLYEREGSMWGFRRLHRGTLKRDGEFIGSGKDIVFLAEGVGATEDDLVIDGLTKGLVLHMGLEGVGLGVDFTLQVFLGIGLARCHDVGKELLHIENMLAAFLMDVLRIHIGQLLTGLLQLVGHLALRLVLGIYQLPLGTAIGEALVVDGEVEWFGDVVFPGVGLTP